MRRRIVFLSLALTVSACHQHGPEVPLTSQNIYFSDKFYDVKSISAERALIIGYGGKILETNDGGVSFTKIDSGTDLALYKLFPFDANRMWISGQQGLILASTDGGKTWQKQDSGTQEYLFSIFFVNENHGYAVGDRSTITETTDGGKTWKARKVARATEGIDSDMLLAMQDPIFYDVRFTDEQNGLIAGEFGHLLKTSDGGQNWTPGQNSLMTPESGIVDPMDLPTFFGSYLLSGQEALVSGLDGKLARTRNGGQTWQFEPMKLAFEIVDPLYQPYMTKDGNGWAVGAAGEVVHLPAGQTEWKRADLGMQIYTWLRSIDFADAQNGWLVGGYGTILRTTDGGKSWRMCLG
ncbi:MAG: WD40/YVTN/BNR-like repeat-containing protein [Candidatus Binatia bacterium]